MRMGLLAVGRQQLVEYLRGWEAAGPGDPYSENQATCPSSQYPLPHSRPVVLKLKPAPESRGAGVGGGRRLLVSTPRVADSAGLSGALGTCRF